MSKGLILMSVVFSLALMLGCTPSKEQLQSMMEKNPEILFSVIEKNPEKFMDTVNQAVQKAQGHQREEQAKAEEKSREDEMKNPKQPVIEADRAIRGPKDAPITIVEYSDFQCPYCSRGYQTVREIEKKYGNKVRIVYKHLPLEFHPKAMPAAEFFEAVAMQDPQKAYEWHDQVFQNQDKLQGDHMKFFKSIAKKLGLNEKKLETDLKSEKIKARITADTEEARKFGFSGTPGFLINGVSLRGAYPAPEFEKIIDQQLAANKK